VYVADWYDKRAAHLDPIDNWDKTNGRVYKIEYQGTKPVPPFDLRTKTKSELVELLGHPNAWWRRQARELLARKKIGETDFDFNRLMDSDQSVAALETLWVLGTSDEWSGKTKNDPTRKEIVTEKKLHVPNYLLQTDADIRAWSIRFSADGWESDAAYPFEANLVRFDKNPAVLIQSLCAAKAIVDRADRGNKPSRLWERVVSSTMELVEAIGANSEAAADPMIPLLAWWAVEPITRRGSTSALRILISLRQDGPITGLIAENTARVVADTYPEAIEILLALMKDPDRRQFRARVLEGLDRGMKRDVVLSGASAEIVRSFGADAGNRITKRLLARAGDVNALTELHQKINDPETGSKVRTEIVGLLRELNSDLTASFVKDNLSNNTSDDVLVGLIACLESQTDPDLFDPVHRQYAGWSKSVKRRAVAMWLTRPAWAIRLLRGVEGGTFPLTDLTLDDARTAAALNDPAVTALVEKIWGKITPATPGEKLARINALLANLGRVGKPDVTNGKALFTQHCAACHVMHGEGGKVGPDLTTADRKNTKYMLTQIVDPSSYIRPEYVQHAVTTTDGRKLLGIVSESSAEGITLLNVIDNKPVKTVVPKGQVDDVKPLPTSLMPEKLLDPLTDEQVRDLLGYLASDPPKK
jgi:putative heme-binding domain-containing protein